MRLRHRNKPGSGEVYSADRTNTGAEIISAPVFVFAAASGYLAVMLSQEEYDEGYDQYDGT
jgi:hypothetical protein